MTKTQDDYQIITNEFIEKYKNKKVNWGFNGLGYVTYKRTYSRIKSNGELEEWYDTIQRCVNGAQKIGAKYTKDEAERLFDYIFNLKCSFAGRMLWQLGTSTVDRFGMNSLLNCWGVQMNCLKAFLFLFENLMLGGGVGFSVRREDIHQLPKIHKNVEVSIKNTKDADFIVPDSREGWVKLLENVLNSYLNTGISFSYSTILVRCAGEPINGFGGKSSGPKILEDGIVKICSVFKSREGKRLRSVDVLDICNILGYITVSGNVRRSAQLSAGDSDDVLFLKAKRWDLGTIPSWRAMSNNTIYADDYDYIMENVWDGYSGNGEPYGFFNLNLCQNYGRLGEKIKDNCVILNPCAEATLANFEPCNLSELFLNNINSSEELCDCAKLLYKTQKAVAAGKYIHEETNEIVKKNMRIGLGVTGICQSINKLDWLDECYKKLKEFDKLWSKENRLQESIKLTVVKPSGSLSLLSGSTPGVHPAYSRYYIRRIRMASNDSLINVCKNSGYNTEFVCNFDGSKDRSTTIISFPCVSSDKSILASEMSAVKQLELVKTLQTVWADQAVSATVYYKKNELDDIKKWLKNNYKSSVKSISFLLHRDHGFNQAPYEEITQERYEQLQKNLTQISEKSIMTGNDLDNLECSNGICPIK